jgi:hypothetical protein
MIFAREKLQYWTHCSSNIFAAFAFFVVPFPPQDQRGRSISQGSSSDQTVREAGASNAVRYTAEPCNEYTSKVAREKITRQE